MEFSFEYMNFEGSANSDDQSLTFPKLDLLLDPFSLPSISSQLDFTLYYRGQQPKQNFVEPHCYCVFNYFIKWSFENPLSLFSNQAAQKSELFSSDRYAMHIHLQDAESQKVYQSFIIMSHSKTTGQGRLRFDKAHSSYYTNKSYQLQFKLKDQQGNLLAETFSTPFKLLTRKPNSKRYSANKPFIKKLKSLLDSAPSTNHKLHALSLLQSSLSS
mmetsp:Transcript_10971/g.16129  ORF Transcript_10971/g.16129 Transcript_10971/m.16129 type:complete len:215 (+) Transcript_10971:329-973(+)